MKNSTDERAMSRTKLIIISVLVSIVLWVIIDRLADPDVKYQTGSITPVITGEEHLRANGYVLADRESIPPCSVTVSGKRNNLIASMDNINVEFDVSSVNRAGTVNVKATVTGADSLKIVKQSYKTAALKFETAASKEDVRVKVKLGDGAESDTGSIIKAVPLTELVTVYGTQKNVDRVKYCMIDLDPQNIAGDSITECAYYFTDENGERLEDAPELSCDVRTISVKCEIFNAHKTALESVNIPDELKNKYKIEFADDIKKTQVTIGVRKDAEAPQSISGTLAESGSFKDGGTQKAEVQFELTEDYYIPEPVKIRVKVTPLIKSSEKAVINTKGLSDGLVIASVTPEFDEESVTVTKPEDVKGDIELEADLTGLGAGTHTVTLKAQNGDIKPESELKAVVVLGIKEE